MTRLAAKLHAERLCNIYFGKSADAVTELEVSETMYTEEERSFELRARVEFLKQEKALAEAAAYIARARDHGTQVPEELVRLVAHCEDLMKRNEQLAKDLDRLRRERSRDQAKRRTSLLPIEQRSLLRILGAIVTSPPYNFNLKIPKNTATTKIFNVTEENEVDQDTVRKWVLEAAKEVARCRE